MVCADGLPDRFNTFLDELGHFPVAGTVGNIEDEMLQELANR